MITGRMTTTKVITVDLLPALPREHLKNPPPSGEGSMSLHVPGDQVHVLVAMELPRALRSQQVDHHHASALSRPESNTKRHDDRVLCTMLPPNSKSNSGVRPNIFRSACGAFAT